MRLLEMATVRTGDGQWMKGWQAEDRMPGLDVEIFDPCGTTDISVVEGESTRTYEVVAFGVKAGIPRSLMCGQSDDETWLSGAAKDALEQAIGLAVCVDHADGTQTWIGDTAVATEADVVAARATWLANNVGAPTLHVADDKIPTLLTSNMIKEAKGEIVTVWGDPVVNSPGYLPGVIFWSGPIEIFVSAIQAETLVNVRNNASRVIANLLAAVDMSPFQVVRVGAVPTPPAMFTEVAPESVPEVATPILPSPAVGGEYHAVPLSGFEEPTPYVEPEPEPEPEPTPESTWLKADILAWLQQHGVTVEGRALTDLTKAELLELVDAVLSPAPTDG